nr:MAG TPA: hypothetical protein [Caudoviricetes sp.]DAS95405.1 MAG TPA: hypothetical protein [Caudoviricetes sp.]
MCGTISSKEILRDGGVSPYPEGIRNSLTASLLAQENRK